MFVHVCLCLHMCVNIGLIGWWNDRVWKNMRKGNVNAQWYIKYAVITSHWLSYKPSNHQLLSNHVCFLQQGLKILHNYNVSYCSSFRTIIAFYTFILQKLASWHLQIQRNVFFCCCCCPGMLFHGSVCFTQDISFRRSCTLHYSFILWIVILNMSNCVYHQT